MAGYSGTPLVKKLGIKEGTKIFLANAPREYLKLVSPLPHGIKVMSMGFFGDENAPVVWIVLNDARLNAVHHGQTLQYAGRTIGTEFSRMDVAGVAEALGAWSRRVVLPGDIGAAVAAALASGRPAVIDVRVDAAEVPPIHSRVRSLDKLFAGDSR